MGVVRKILARESILHSLFLCSLVLFGICAWMLFAWPRFSVLSLKIDRGQAVRVAEDYLAVQYAIAPGKYRKAAVFVHESHVDRFLQKALGTQLLNNFVKRNDYELYYWVVRFFRPGDKEEFRVVVSSRSGKVIRRAHTIDESAQRDDAGIDSARDTARKFLTGQGIDFSLFELKDEVRTAFDHRVQYGFSWRKKAEDVAWSSLPDDGTGKLLTGAEVSGHEILSFTQSRLDIPDRFNRFLDAQDEVGRNFSLAFSFFYYFILVLTIVLLTRSRMHLALRSARPFVLLIGSGMGLCLLFEVFNYKESILSGYQTSQDLFAFLTRTSLQTFLSVIVVVSGFVIVALAGEGECARVSRDDGRSFLYFVRSSFLTRRVARDAAVSYAIAACMLGVQAILFFIGEKYCGVWSELQGLTQFSTAYWPWLAAFSLGFRASLTEEIMFRVFLLNWVNNRWKNMALAILVSSLVWGFGHTGYQLYPMWFRGVEVSILGLLLAWAYLRYGLLVALCAHFLFDVFWSGSGSLFTASAPGFFWSTFFVLALPALWGGVAFFFDRSSSLRPLAWHLHPAQKLNFEILHAYVAASSFSPDERVAMRNRLLRQNWDPAVVAKVFQNENIVPDA